MGFVFLVVYHLCIFYGGFLSAHTLRFVVDHKEELAKLQNSYKEEKQEKKKLRMKLEHMEEEIQEVKQEKESAVKVISAFLEFS